MNNLICKLIGHCPYLAFVEKGKSETSKGDDRNIYKCNRCGIYLKQWLFGGLVKYED